MELKGWKEENQSLKMDLQRHMSTGEAKNWTSTVEILRKEKNEATVKQDDLLAQINKLSN